GDEAAADVIDERLEPRVRMGAAELAGHLGRGLEAHRDLLLRRQRDALLLARDGVDRRAAQVRDDRHQRDDAGDDPAAADGATAAAAVIAPGGGTEDGHGASSWRA